MMRATGPGIIQDGKKEYKEGDWLPAMSTAAEDRLIALGVAERVPDPPGAVVPSKPASRQGERATGREGDQKLEKRADDPNNLSMPEIKALLVKLDPSAEEINLKRVKKAELIEMLEEAVEQSEARSQESGGGPAEEEEDATGALAGLGLDPGLTGTQTEE